jgi:hypothetical protein
MRWFTYQIIIFAPFHILFANFIMCLYSNIYHSVNNAGARISTYCRLTLTKLYIAQNNVWDNVYFESVLNNAY